MGEYVGSVYRKDRSKTVARQDSSDRLALLSLPYVYACRTTHPPPTHPPHLTHPTPPHPPTHPTHPHSFPPTHPTPPHATPPHPLMATAALGVLVSVCVCPCVYVCQMSVCVTVCLCAVQVATSAAQVAASAAQVAASAALVAASPIPPIHPTHPPIPSFAWMHAWRTAATLQGSCIGITRFLHQSEKISHTTSTHMFPM